MERQYVFEDGTRVDKVGYLDGKQIREEEKIHGRLIYVSDGHTKVVCVY